MRIILIILSCLLLMTPSAAAGEPLDWTPAVAQMLASEGWEHYTPKPLAPVVGYGVHFVELSAAVVEKLVPQFSVRSGQTPEVGWEVSWDAELLKELALDTPVFRLILEGADSSGEASTYYSSWLVTVGNQPLYVNLSERNLTKQENDSLFQLGLTPIQIDPVRQSVLTQITLKFNSDLGAASQVELISWVDSEASAPMAVVAKTELAAGKVQKRYFALFVSCFVVPPERIPGYVPIVSIGNLIGLQRVFGKAEAKAKLPPSQFEAGMTFDSRGVGGYLSGRYASERSILTGQLYFGQELDYGVNVRLLLYEHLALLTAVEPRTDRLAPLVRLGIGDEVWLTPNFRFNADLYIVEIAAKDTNAPPVTQELKVEFGFGYESEAVTIAYQGMVYQGELAHQVKSTISLAESWGLAVTYSYTEKEHHRVTFGITFSKF